MPWLQIHSAVFVFPLSTNFQNKTGLIILVALQLFWDGSTYNYKNVYAQVK